MDKALVCGSSNMGSYPINHTNCTYSLMEKHFATDEEIKGSTPFKCSNKFGYLIYLMYICIY